MLIFLYGEDTYRSFQKLNEIRERYLGIHNQAINLREFECAAVSINEIEEELKTHSLFKEKKLIILKNVFKNADLAQFLFKRKELLDPNDISVFFEEGKIKTTQQATKSLFRFLTKNAKTQEFTLLTTTKLNEWILRRFELYKTNTHKNVIDFLAKEIGNDLWRMSQEIQKLAALSRSYHSFISMAEAEHVVAKNAATVDIFSTIDDIGLKNKARALEKVAHHIQNGESPLYLLSMFSFQFRNLLLIKNISERHGSKTKLHPFIVKKGLGAAQRFTFQELKQTYQKIFDIDYGVKTGAIGQEMALYLFIARL